MPNDTQPVLRDINTTPSASNLSAQNPYDVAHGAHLPPGFSLRFHQPAGRARQRPRHPHHRQEPPHAHRHQHLHSQPGSSRRHHRHVLHPLPVPGGVAAALGTRPTSCAPWRPWCRVISVNVSIFTLTVIAMDRYIRRAAPVPRRLLASLRRHHHHRHLVPGHRPVAAVRRCTSGWTTVPVEGRGTSPGAAFTRRQSSPRFFVYYSCFLGGRPVPLPAARHLLLLLSHRPGTSGARGGQGPTSTPPRTSGGRNKRKVSLLGSFGLWGWAGCGGGGGGGEEGGGEESCAETRERSAAGFIRLVLGVGRRGGGSWVWGGGG